MATQNAIDSEFPVVTLTVSDGGTGATTLTNHGVLVGSGAAAITPLAVGATGTLLVGATAGDPAFATIAVGDFSFTTAVAGATRILSVTNTDNTNAASAARIDVNTGGASAGDPQFSYIVNGVTTWSQGLDNSDSDKFKISASATLGTTDVVRFAVSGEMTMPLQPAFGAKAATQNDVTGDGTTYTITFTDAEYFDQNNDFDGTSTFTASVDGKYQFNIEIFVDDLTSSHTDGNITLSTSNRDYTSSYISPAAAKTATDNCSFHLMMLVDMDATDTAVAKVTVSNGTKVVDIIAGNTFFNGYLAT